MTEEKEPEKTETATEKKIPKATSPPAPKVQPPQVRRRGGGL